jgi:hypothetical protein
MYKIKSILLKKHVKNHTPGGSRLQLMRYIRKELFDNMPRQSKALAWHQEGRIAILPSWITPS